VPEVFRESAPAKINPYLRVLGKRPDGYHEIETLILPISLADHVAVTLRDEGFALRVTGPLADRVPAGDENLAVRAARALADAIGEHRGANILIEKHVPVAAGLGGGSSDAAATLRALSDLWGAGLSVERLAEIGAAVGSDVPALVHARPVIARGRGEQVVPATVPETWWVIVTSGDGIASADAYSWWDAESSGGALKREDPDAVLKALERGDVENAGQKLFNDLEPGVLVRRPSARQAKMGLLRGGLPSGRRGALIGGNALGAILSGSGSAVVGLCTDRMLAYFLAWVMEGISVSSIPSDAHSVLG
jgi:4-diphosphocytidyl-2C-methyl-D-erythritol kinase